MNVFVKSGSLSLASSWVAACCVLTLVAAVVVTGCSRSGPAVEFVAGEVLLDGSPLADANIGFSPADGPGLGAFGRTDATGKYRLTTAQGGQQLGGAPVGSYIVTVRKYRNRLDELGPRPGPEDPVAAGKWDAEAKRLGELPPESVIPVGYGEKSSSGLKATVKKGRNVGPEFRYELRGDFKGG
jgi:hypothetical protein